MQSFSDFVFPSGYPSLYRHKLPEKCSVYRQKHTFKNYASLCGRDEMICCTVVVKHLTTKSTMRRRSFSNIYWKETSCCTAVHSTILNDCDVLCSKHFFSSPFGGNFPTQFGKCFKHCLVLLSRVVRYERVIQSLETLFQLELNRQIKSYTEAQSNRHFGIPSYGGCITASPRRFRR